MSLWFFGWVGTLFLSSTRVIFAAAFDRVLPDRAAEVSEKRKVPFYSLILMLLPAVGPERHLRLQLHVRHLHAGRDAGHRGDLPFSSIAVVILPWRKPELWQASPASKIKVLGVPIVPAAGVITLGLLGFCLYEWLTQRPLRVQQARLAVLHGRDVPAGHRHLSWRRGSSAGGRASTSA